MRKWPLKKKNHISKSFKLTFKKATNTGKILQNNVKKYFETVLPKKCCFDENVKFLDISGQKCYFLPFYVWRLMTGFVQMGHICKFVKSNYLIWLL